MKTPVFDLGPTMEELRDLCEMFVGLPEEERAWLVAKASGYAEGYRNGLAAR